MSKYTSKTGKINISDEKVYLFLSDFNNLKNVIPTDKVSDFTSTADSCRFSVSGIGQAGLKIVEKEPNSLIKISSDGKSPFGFFFWIQLKPIDEDKTLTAIRLTIEADINPMMKMMIGSHMQKGIDGLLDYIVQFFNEKFEVKES